MEDGEESQSLLCSETFSSPTPPSGDSGWNDTSNGCLSWSQPQAGVKLEIPLKDEAPSPDTSLRSNGTVHYSVIENQAFNICRLVPGGRPKDHLLKAALLGGLHAKSETYLIAFEKDINSNLQAKCGIDSQQFVGNDGESCRRMSGSNGYDGNRMTGSSSGGSNENLNRLSDGSGPQGQPQPQQVQSEGMLMGRLGGVTVQDVGTRSIVAGTVGAGPQVTIGGIFRPPQSVSDSGRTFATAYTTTAGGASPFSPLYSSHGPGMASYSAFYSQYPGYNTGMHSGLDPQQIGSYSAVLQSMGSHAAQSQVPRSPYGAAGAGGLGQYPLLSVTQPSSMGKPYLQNSASMSSAQEREELKYRQREQELDIQRRHSTTGVIPDEKPHHFSVPSAYTEASRGASLSSAPRESPTQKREPSGGEFYKVPYSAREGSLKHRILRPSEPVTQSNLQHSAFTNTDEPLPKRTKTETLDLSKGPPKYSTNILGEVAPSDRERGASTSGPLLHYPQHFMKGSIIQLAHGALKRVEDLETDDFVHSADISSDLKIDSCTVVHIEENRVQGMAVLGFVVGEHKVQVTVEATLEHPFFVFGQGWSSCEPQCTFSRYGLQCHRLSVGDVCISLTHKEVTAHAAEISQQQQRQQQNKQLESPSTLEARSLLEGRSMLDGRSTLEGRSSIEGRSTYSKTIKLEEQPRRDSPCQQRNKSPGHSHSPSNYGHSQGQGYRSETGQSDSGGHHPDARRYDSPSSSQIPSSSPSQEQTSHSHAS